MEKQILLLFTLLLLQGCGEKAETFTKDLDKQEIQVVNFSDIKITFPPGSLDDKVEITIKKFNRPQKEDLSEGTGISPVYTITLDKQPVKPVIVDINFDPGAIPDGKDYKNLVMLVKNGETWAPPPRQLVDIEGNKITVTLSELTAVTCGVSKKTNNTINRKVHSLDKVLPWHTDAYAR